MSKDPAVDALARRLGVEPKQSKRETLTLIAQRTLELGLYKKSAESTTLRASAASKKAK